MCWVNKQRSCIVYVNSIKIQIDDGPPIPYDFGKGK